MEDDLITTKEVGDYRIKVYYCHDSECPITNWGLFGSFFFEYSDMHRLHDECNGSLGNENFYVCKPLSFYKSQQEIQKVNPLYAFKVATAYFREQGKVPVFEDSNCRLIKL